MALSTVISQLEKVTFETEIRKVNDIFETLLLELESYLGLNSIRRNVKIIFSTRSETRSGLKEEDDIFNIGVKRDLKSNSLELFKSYSKFFPIILLREAYYCFLSEVLIGGKYVPIIIHQLILNNLSNFSSLNKWKSYIDQQIVDDEFMQSYLGRLGRFLEDKSRVQFTLECLRENAPIIKGKKEDVFEYIFNQYLMKTAKSLNNDEIIETLLVLINIFYEAKSYKSLSEYKDYFQEYKEKYSRISTKKTNLSLRKFIENMRWVKEHTSISPSYQVNWMYLNVVIGTFHFEFHPFLGRKNILKVIEKLPFIAYFRLSRNSATTEMSGYFIIPDVYLKDLLSFVEKMYANGYLLKKECYQIKKMSNILNLNYFREFHNSQKKLIDIDHNKYNKKYEIEFNVGYLPMSTYPELSVVDLNIFDKLINFSITGFTFERRIETLRQFKEDMKDVIRSEEKVVGDIKEAFEKLRSKNEYRTDLLLLINKFHGSEESSQEPRKSGFFSIQFFINDLLECLDEVKRILSDNPEIKNIYQLRDFIKINGISKSLRTNILITNKQINKMVFNDFIPVYFQSEGKFIEKLAKYQFFKDFFILCSRIKVYNLTLIKQIIKHEQQQEKIYWKRDNKLKKYYEIINPDRITSEDIESKLDKFISHDPPIIKPLLMNTIATSTFSNYFPLITLKDIPTVREKLKTVLIHFPRSIVQYCKELFTSEEQIEIAVYLPNIKEKELLLSVLHTFFSDDLLSFKRIYWGGLIYFQRAFKNFYDYDTNQFFYNKDLYGQYYKYVENSLGDVPKIADEKRGTIERKLWYTEKNMKDLTNEVEERFSHENIDHDIASFNSLVALHTSLTSNLVSKKLMSNNNQTAIIEKYIKSIKFIPIFHRFGLSQYFLFIHPFSLDATDLKLLLSNTFQKARYPARIDPSTSLFISYIFPYRNPNMAYINRLTKTLRNTREYFMFFVKNLTQLFHFDSNLSEDNRWDYNPERFEMHIQNILFNPSYKPQKLKIKQCDLGSLKSSEVFGFNSDNFKKLVEIYNWKADDLKLYYDTNDTIKINLVSDLLRKNLIFPFISLKNLNLIEKVYVILPNLKKELNQKVKQIFEFFNFGFIYEIEGEYYIYDLKDVIHFENGLMIKLYFPDCKMFKFQNLFESVFHYLGIEHYLILNDLVDGKKLLKVIYDDLDFLDNYNPLKNLKWSE